MRTDREEIESLRHGHVMLESVDKFLAERLGVISASLEKLTERVDGLRPTAIPGDARATSFDLTPTEVEELRTEHAALTEWKRQHLIVNSWWGDVDAYVRAHPSTVVGESVVAAALRLLKERDTCARALGMINEASKTRYRVMPLDYPDFRCPTS